MQATEQCVIVDNVTKEYAKKAVLKEVSIQVQKAEIYGFLGPSGAGKTTLVKIIAGIEEATNGTVNVFGEAMPKLHLMQRMGYMTQSDALYEEMSALENLDFFASIYGLKGAKKKQRINEVMELVGLSEDIRKIVANYSGGMKRRLSLATALLHEPELVLLDEPTVGIDPVLRNTIWIELERLSKQGKTIIVTTHVMDEAERCHRLAMLRDGKLIASGSPADLKEAANVTSLEQVFLKYGGGLQ